MNNYFMSALALIAGLGLGAVFFGGLWWTIRKGLASNHPALWFLGSLLLRMSVILSGFYWVGHGHWQRLMLCLVGFVLARLVVTRLSRLLESRQTDPIKEASRAT